MDLTDNPHQTESSIPVHLVINLTDAMHETNSPSWEIELATFRCSYNELFVYKPDTNTQEIIKWLHNDLVQSTDNVGSAEDHIAIERVVIWVRTPTTRGPCRTPL